MKLKKDDVEWFMAVYASFEGEPNENDITFRLPGMMRLCEDWMEQEAIIARQQKWLRATSWTMTICGILLFGIAANETVKKCRTKQEKKALKEEFLQTWDEGGTPVILNDMEGAR